MVEAGALQAMARSKPSAKTSTCPWDASRYREKRTQESQQHDDKSSTQLRLDFCLPKKRRLLWVNNNNSNNE